MLIPLMTSLAAATDTIADSAEYEVAIPSALRAPSYESLPAFQEVDVLVQLRANLTQLEDLHGRLSFMMGELSYLLRKS